MNIVPIAFAFDNNLVFPTCISISSLMMNAAPDTFYDIFILYPGAKGIERDSLDKLPDFYPNCRLSYIAVGDVFDNAFEIRGITTPAYYRLLIPELIPQYDKVLYSDADIIFRMDLAELYRLNIDDCYLAATRDLMLNYDSCCRNYVSTHLKLPAGSYFQSGFILMNSLKMCEDGLTKEFRAFAGRKYKYQDQDILNVVCQGKVRYMSPEYDMTDYSYFFLLENRNEAERLFSDTEIEDALDNGNIHYNGHKPWKKYSVNFDIWWEYYRKSPFFDRQFYFDFFYRKLDEYDRLPLWKRVKILARWFVFGKKH